ncbi:MAG TPA: glycoside hydrolase family 9 protein, partial [Candidatus Goldiibacteriota bacterium]|nr:glycoside hydrolase family 9 protein [Candidatus Goldiibacteriota bacterium]
AFAIGARLFSAYTGAYPGYAATLQTAADRAWAFLTANPNNIQYNHTNFDNANANQDDNAEKRLRFLAAAELYRATGNATYRTYCDNNYNNANTADGGYQPITSNSFMPGAGDNMKRGLVSYCVAPGATAAVVSAIKTAIRNGADWYITANLGNCPYRSYMWEGHYCWGSNGMKADWGNIAMYAVNTGANPPSDAAYRAAAEEYVHYFHGRNATAFCYLTQSNTFGADKQINEIYHSWFHHGTAFDTNPAPGFLAGGPNRDFAPASGSIIPPQNQPPMKAYKDWNTSWPENSWEVTENSTGYQSRQVLLLAAFAGSSGPTATPTMTPTNTPYLGTPTFTPTRTRTATNTPYLSPTVTPTNTPQPA